MISFRFDRILSFTLGSWPFIVSLNRYDSKFKRYIHSCGGIIINRYQIVTAGHCFERQSSPQDWIIIAGRNDIYIPEIHKSPITDRLHNANNLENVYLPKEIIVHGGHRKDGEVNDISMIILKKPLKLDDKTMTSIKLASNTPKSNDNCKVAGWGAINDHVGILSSYPCQLHEAKVKIRNFQECRVNYFVFHARQKSVKNFSDLRNYNAKDLAFDVQDQQNFCAGGDKSDSCSVR